MPNAGVGWLRGTFRGVERDDVLRLLQPFFGASVPRAGATRWYRSTASLADRRVVVAWDGQGGATGTVMVDVTQGALDGLGWARSIDLLRELDGQGFRASRLDVYLDDRQRLADPRDVYQAVGDLNVVTHARGGQWMENRQGGATAYVGVRESERFLRVYRTGPVHGFEATRWEIENKRDAARSALRLLTSSHEPMIEAVRLLVSFVDFRGRVDGQRGSRAPRLAWWAALVGSLTKVAGVTAVRIDSVARRATWLRRQVAPSLAAVWASYGSGWLNDLLSDGLDRQGGLSWARN